MPGGRFRIFRENADDHRRAESQWLGCGRWRQSCALTGSQVAFLAWAADRDEA